MFTHAFRRSRISSGQNETSYSRPTSLGRPIANLRRLEVVLVSQNTALLQSQGSVWSFGFASSRIAEKVCGDNPGLQTCWNVAGAYLYMCMS